MPTQVLIEAGKHGNYICYNSFGKQFSKTDKYLWL